MLILGISVVLAVVVLVKWGIDKDSLELSFWIVFLGLCISHIVAGILTWIVPFDESYVKERVPLVSLSNTIASEGKGNLFYVGVSSNNLYSYRYEVDSEFGTSDSKEYKVGIIEKNDYIEEIIEIEDPLCTNPEMIIYEKKSKMTIWIFPYMNKKEAVAFSVPPGSIQKEIVLK
jgi:hypothetical protein